MRPPDPLDRAQTYLAKFTGMKTVPSVATRLVTMIEQDKSSLQDFESVIKVDPTLVLRLIKLVNSSYFSLRTKIKTISEALVYIGIDNLRNMIVLDAIKNLFLSDSDAGPFSRNRLWMHSSVTSICCQMISERIFAQKGEDAFLCGILHDVGLIVEDQVAHDRFVEFCRTFEGPAREIGVTGHETAVMGTHHSAVGHLLTREWGLSTEVCQALRLHHKSLNDVDPGSLTGILQISEYLTFRLGYDAFPDIQDKLSVPLLAHIKENIMGYRAILDDLPDELHRVKEIYSLEKPDDR